MIDILVEHGANIKEGQSRMPLCAAIETKNMEIIKYFIDNGADVNCISNNHCLSFGYETPLNCAIDTKKIDIVKYIVDQGAEICKNNKEYSDNLSTPLLCAVSTNVLEIVQFIVDNGADVNELSAYGKGIPFLVE